MPTPTVKELKPRKYTYKDGTIRYKLNGKLHRLDGPSEILVDGTQLLYINGQVHRTDGPALVDLNGTQYWYLNGVDYTFNDFCKELKLTYEDIVFLKLKYNTLVSA